MVVLNVIFAISWLIGTIALFFGYEPPVFTVGCAFLLAVLSHVFYALDIWAQKGGRINE